MRKGFWWGVHAVAAGALVVMTWRAIAPHWGELQSLQATLTPRPTAFTLSILLTVVAYAMQIEAWRRILAGWAQHLPYGRVARIWLLANLGRYVPGKVWSFAGLIVLARREGVEAWAAGASPFAIQGVALGTAAVVVAASIPAVESPLRLATAGILAAGTVALLTWRRAVRKLAGLASRVAAIEPLSVWAVAESSAFMLGSWLAYGGAFWLLASVLGPPAAVSLPTAAGVFAFGCMLGVLAPFAPGGIGVREMAFVELLTPALGGASAVALSVSSRVILTLCEIAAVFTVLLITRGSSKTPSRRLAAKSCKSVPRVQ
jgi:hypothetical protein